MLAEEAEIRSARLECDLPKRLGVYKLKYSTHLEIFPKGTN